MNRNAKLAAIAALMVLAPANAPASALAPTGSLSITVDGLRSARGMIRVCVTANPRAFPDCSRDAAARTASIAAANGAVLDFQHLVPGRYAVSLLHDENANGKVDKFLMIPTEGYGFSRNASVRFGPPSFSAAAVEIGASALRTRIRMRYM